MSFTNNDRKVQSKTGKTFHNGSAYDRFAEAIGEALRAEFGGAPASIKTIGRLTHSNERAVRNWFDGRNGPSGENLVALMQHSEQVLQIVLQLSGRNDLLLASSFLALRERFRSVLQAMDELHPS